MIRNSIYCMYKGKEFRFVHKADGSYQVVTEDKRQIDSSFEHYQGTIYCKEVSLSDIDEVYSVNSYAIYNGDTFEIIHATAKEVIIVTNDERIAYENKMNQSGKFEFRKTVSLSEIEVYEQKRKIQM